jgi:hypothetical protein
MVEFRESLGFEALRGGNERLHDCFRSRSATSICSRKLAQLDGPTDAKPNAKSNAKPDAQPNAQSLLLAFLAANGSPPAQ